MSNKRTLRLFSLVRRFVMAGRSWLLFPEILEMRRHLLTDGCGFVTDFQNRFTVRKRDGGKERNAHGCYTEGKRQTFDQLSCGEPHECLHPCRSKSEPGGGAAL